MSESYQKVGRGGAGNFYSKEDVKDTVAQARFDHSPSLPLSSLSSSLTLSLVPEADLNHKQQTPSTLESQPISPSLPTNTTPTQPPREYAHTGRGGAGNWVKPSTLLLPGTDQNSTSLESPKSPTIPERGTSLNHTRQNVTGEIPATKAVYRGGRGGAGNYSWGDDTRDVERVNRETEEREKEDEIQRIVKGEVDGGLAAPPKAFAVRGGGRDRVG